MFRNTAQYDRHVNTFSPEGRLFQVEYAIEAIKMGSTSVGIQVAEGVVLASERRVNSPLLVAKSLQRILEVDEHVGAAMAGLVADARTLIDHARVEVQSHWFSFDERMKIESIAQSVCDVSLGFGEGDNVMSRPYGVALLFGGVDSSGPTLWHTDPSGTFTNYLAKAIGAGSEAAQTKLQDEYNRSMSLSEARVLAVQTLKDVMEDAVMPENVEVAEIRTSDAKFRLLSAEEIEATIALLAPDVA